MGPLDRTADEKLARIASRSHGVVTRRALVEGGLTVKEIRSRVARGTLLRVHPGVYRVGHRAPSVAATYLAAVLAGGDGAVLSGRAAVYLWGLSKGQAPPSEVTATTERRIEGVKTRRCRDLSAQDVTVHRGIPVTTVARTLVDVAADTSEEQLARLCHEAGVRYGLTPNAVVQVLERRANAPGAARLKRVIAGDVHVTLSKLEKRFLEHLRREGFPLPVTNRPAGGRRVDCRWPEYRLTVELDSYRFHNSRHSWELDRKREREARARGDEFRRYTYGDVMESPAAMLRELHAFFSAKRPAAELGSKPEAA